MNEEIQKNKPSEHGSGTTKAVHGSPASGAASTSKPSTSTASTIPASTSTASTHRPGHEEPWKDRPGAGVHEDPWGYAGDREHHVREPGHGERRHRYGGNGPARSVIGTLRELAIDVGLLVQQEIQLARTEIGEKVDQVKTGMGEMAIGIALSYAGFLFVLGALTFALNLALDRMWLSTLIVGGSVLLIGLALLAAARSNLKANSLKPKRTARSLREGAEMVRNETTRRSHV